MPRRNIAIPPFAFADIATRAVIPSWMLGEKVPPAHAQRRVRIDARTRHVHVRQGEAVCFVADRGEFGYRFLAAQGDTSFDLCEVAPRGLLDHGVRVYIATGTGTR